MNNINNDAITISFDPSTIVLNPQNNHFFFDIIINTNQEFEELYIYPSKMIGINVFSLSDIYGIERIISFNDWMRTTPIKIPLRIDFSQDVEGNSDLYFYFYFKYNYTFTISYSILNENVNVKVPPHSGPLKIVNAYGVYSKSKNLLQLYFEIKNLGSGLFFNPDVFNKQFKGKVSLADYNKFAFLRYHFGTDEFQNCEVGEMANDKIKVKCEIVFNQITLEQLKELKNKEFNKIVHIRLIYGYVISQKIYIQKE
ncbi:MAG: hypothetical protein QXR30_00420 [Candidatus Woesearchaeota archaeon]